MISFRCWYCGRRYRMPETRVGERLSCSCKHPLRVPKRSGGRSRALTPLDWLVEAVVYGGGGGLLGFGLAELFLDEIPVGLGCRGHLLVSGGLALAGFLLGLFGGEAGINSVGRLIRRREE